MVDINNPRDFALRALTDDNTTNSVGTDYSDFNFNSLETEITTAYPTGTDEDTVHDNTEEEQNTFLTDVTTEIFINAGVDADDIDSNLVALVVEEAIENAGENPKLGDIVEQIQAVLERYDVGAGAGDTENDDTLNIEATFNNFAKIDGSKNADTTEVTAFFEEFATDLGVTLPEGFVPDAAQNGINQDEFEILLAEFEALVSGDSNVDSTNTARDFDDIEINPNDDLLLPNTAITNITQDINTVLELDETDTTYNGLVTDIISQLTEGQTGQSVTPEIYDAALQIAEKIISNKTGEDLFGNVDSDDVILDEDTGAYRFGNYTYTPSEDVTKELEPTIGDVFDSLKNNPTDTTLDVDAVDGYIETALSNAGIDVADLNPSLEAIKAAILGTDETVTQEQLTALLAVVEAASGAELFDTVSRPDTNTLSDDATTTEYNIINKDGTSISFDVSNEGEYIYNQGTQTNLVGTEQATLSSEVLNETADAYFESVLGEGRNNVSLGTLFTQYGQDDVTLLSELPAYVLIDNSSGSYISDEDVNNDIKFSLKAILGDEYDEDAVDIAISAARSNLGSDATLKDLYTEVESIIQGDTPVLSKDDDTDDTINVAYDFKDEDTLFDTLTSDSIILDSYDGTLVSGDALYDTNKTLEPESVKAFLNGYIQPPLPEAYLTELLETADSNDNGTINRDEFKSILKTINNDIKNAAGSTNENLLGLSDELLADTDIPVITLTEKITQGYGFNRATADAALEGQNLESNTIYDTDFSKDVLNETVDAFFVNYFDENDGTLRANETFSRPDDISEQTEIRKPFTDDSTVINIKEQLTAQFDVDADTADLIIKAAIENTDTTPLTAGDLYTEVENLINGTSAGISATPTYAPNITEDFGDISTLFAILNNSSATDYNSSEESTTNAVNSTLDSDTAQAFLSAYIDPAELEEKNVNLEDLINEADGDGDGALNEFEFQVLLENLNVQLAGNGDGDDVNNNPLGLPQTGYIELS